MKSKPQIVFLLAGGKGTRLGDLTNDTPKPMLYVGVKPLIQHLIEWYRSFGLRRFILAVGYKKEKIKEYFGDGSKLGVDITYTEEDEPLGTGGPLKLAEEYIKSTFIFGNGDILTSFNLLDMINFHLKNDGIITTALKEVKDPWRFGVAVLDGTKIIKFIEKPSKGQEPSNLMNAGVHIIEPEMINLIPEKKPCSFEIEIMPKIVERGKAHGYKITGPWLDIGLPETLRLADEVW